MPFQYVITEELILLFRVSLLTPSTEMTTNGSKPRSFEPHEESATQKSKIASKRAPPANVWWIRLWNRPHCLCVFPSSKRGGLAVGETASSSEDGVVGGANLVEE